MKLIAIILSACVASTLAQDLGVPLSWRVRHNVLGRASKTNTLCHS
jgi:hypothetical protein